MRRSTERYARGTQCVVVPAWSALGSKLMTSTSSEADEKIKEFQGVLGRLGLCNGKGESEIFTKYSLNMSKSSFH